MSATIAGSSASAPSLMLCHSASTSLANALGALVVDEDLDARLVDVVAAAVLIVEPQHRLDIAQHVALGQERLDRLGDERRAAKPAADHHFEADLARAVAVQAQAEIVDLDRGAVVLGRGDRDLELARQELKFRMQRQVLAQQLGPDARVFDLVGRNAGPLVGRDVAHAIAAGLHAVQAGLGQVRHGVRQFRELDPVELDVLARGEVAVAAVVPPRDMRQPAHLVRRQRAVGNGDPQHVGVQLQIDAVHQPQRLEFVLGQFAGQPARDLAAEFVNPFRQQSPVEFVVVIHATLHIPKVIGRSMVGPRMRIISRRLPGECCRRSSFTGAR